MSDPRLTTSDWLTQRDALRVECCSGNPKALAFLATVMDVVEIWDDLIDRDKPVSDSEVHHAFLSCLYTLPSNDFFLQHRGYLLPVLMTCINAWMDANELEKSSDSTAQATAWYLKQMGVELYCAVAFLTGGFDHMRKLGPRIRWTLRHEDLPTFLKEHNHA